MISKLKAEVAELKAKLAKAMLKETFAATKTDKAVLVHDTDELGVGTEVFVEDEEGNRTPAADGIYTLEDGRRIKVTEGKVEEILEAEEETETETEVEAAEETPAEEYATKAELEALATAVAELTAVVNELAAKVVGVTTEMSARLAKVEQTPAGKTPAKEYKTEEGHMATGDPVIDKKLAIIRKFKK
jgi:hypothetical protein